MDATLSARLNAVAKPKAVMINEESRKALGNVTAPTQNKLSWLFADMSVSLWMSVRSDMFAATWRWPGNRSASFLSMTHPKTSDVRHEKHLGGVGFTSKRFSNSETSMDFLTDKSNGFNNRSSHRDEELVQRLLGRRSALDSDTATFQLDENRKI